MTAAHHSWSAPQRFLYKSERSCLNGCSIVKVTRHEGGRHWIEFYCDDERIDVGGKTPPCPNALPPLARAKKSKRDAARIRARLECAS